MVIVGIVWQSLKRSTSVSLFVCSGQFICRSKKNISWKCLFSLTRLGYVLCTVFGAFHSPVFCCPSPNLFSTEYLSKRMSKLSRSVSLTVCFTQRPNFFGIELVCDNWVSLRDRGSVYLWLPEDVLWRWDHRWGWSQTCLRTCCPLCQSALLLYLQRLWHTQEDRKTVQSEIYTKKKLSPVNTMSSVHAWC